MLNSPVVSIRNVLQIQEVKGKKKSTHYIIKGEELKFIGILSLLNLFARIRVLCLSLRWSMESSWKEINV